MVQRISGKLEYCFNLTFRTAVRVCRRTALLLNVLPDYSIMRPHTSVFIATSLDGYISRADGNIDWLMDANKRVPAGEDCGYAKFINDVDVIVMGRHTFELACTFEPWPYKDKRVFVLSSNGMSIPGHLASSVTASTEAPAALLARLADEGAKRVYVDGGKTIQSFLAHGLIDELTITLIPVLLGTGRPLFGSLHRDVTLRLHASRAFDFGFVQNVYRINGEQNGAAHNNE